MARDEAHLQRLYRRKLEQWGRSVVDERERLFVVVQALVLKGVSTPGGDVRGSWESDRCFTQAHLLLIAVRNVWRFARLVAALDESGETSKHVSSFEHYMADAKDFRDFLEHFDEYARGGGRERARLPEPADLGGFVFDTERFPGLAYAFGGKRIELDEVATSAIALAQSLLGEALTPPERQH